MIVGLAVALLVGRDSAGPILFTTTYDLVWRPVEGEQHRYKLDVRFDFGGSELELKSTLATKVFRIAADGSYTVAATSTNGTYISQGVEQRLPEQPPSMTRFSKLGAVLEDRASKPDDDPFSRLINSLTRFQPPTGRIAIGKSWTSQLATNLRESDRSYVTYRLESVAGKHGKYVAKVRYTAKDRTGGELAKGSLFLSMPRFPLSRLEAVIPSFQPEGASEPVVLVVHLDEMPPMR